MIPNKIIKAALIIIRLFKFLLLLFLLALTAMFAYSFFDEDYFSKIVVDHLFSAGFDSFKIGYCKNCSSLEHITLNELTIATKVWFWMRLMIFYVLTFLILHTLEKVIRNVSAYNTFFEDNVIYFRTAAKLTFAIAFFSVFNFNFENDTVSWFFTIPFKTVGLALGFLVLSEIFKEGKTLVDDKNSII